MKTMLRAKNAERLDAQSQSAVANRHSPKLNPVADKSPPIQRTAFILGILAVLLAPLPSDATDVYYYTPEHVGNITGRAFADTAPPPNLLGIVTFGCGTNAVSQTIDWQMSPFTGVISPDPIGNYQRGISNSEYGSTAVQMTDQEMGGQLHTYSLARATNNYNLSNLGVNYSWSAATVPKPWIYTNSVFKFSFNMISIASYMEGGAVGYIGANMLLKDENGKWLWFGPQLFDTRGAPTNELVMWDTSTATAIAAS